MVDLLAHEAPLEAAPVSQERAATPVKKVSTEPVVVPLVLPTTRHKLRSLSAAQIRAVMHEKNLPCTNNKLDNIATLLAHMEEAKRAPVPLPAPTPVPVDPPNPFLNGHKFPPRDESPLSMHVLSPETVGASIHEDLGDTRYVWFYQPWCLK